MKKTIRTIAAVLCAVTVLGISAAAAYPDVSPSDWYSGYVDRCTALGIINGYEDGTFRPTGYLRRGEFIKMLASTVELPVTSALPGAHWAEPYWAELHDNGLLNGLSIGCTYDELQSQTTRYEMAVMIANYLTIVSGETPADTARASAVIPDYASIPAGYVSAVAQVYAKGIINGMTNTSGIVNGSFCGERKLTRAQAAAVMVRLIDRAERLPTDLSAPADGNPYRVPNAPNGTKPFAIWAKEKGYVNGTDLAPELCELMFGSRSKTYFASAAEAAPYVTNVTVNVWKLNGKGEKYASTAVIEVHKYLAADVYDIFEQIFRSPEQFPVNAVSGARYTDFMRHAWAAAIDINPDQNFQADNDGSITPLCGNGWWPVGTERTVWAYALAESSPYSIGAGSSVVKAFADYGWGWGGSWSDTYKDYMHFSMLEQGW